MPASLTKFVLIVIECTRLSFWVGSEILHGDLNARDRMLVNSTSPCGAGGTKLTHLLACFLLQRTQLIQRWMDIAQASLDLHDYNSMFAIITGLEQPYITRLVTAIQMLSKADAEHLESLKLTIGHENNYQM